jgi:hypothetical protein
VLRFNRELVGLYRHVMLVDGNDDRGINVGIMTTTGYDIQNIRSHVDDEDGDGEVFSRDCADYQIKIPGATNLHVLVNHFKSQSGGGGDKRKRLALARPGVSGARIRALFLNPTVAVMDPHRDRSRALPRLRRSVPHDLFLCGPGREQAAVLVARDPSVAPLHHFHSPQ